MSDEGRVAGDPTEVLTRSGGSSYVSLTAEAPVATRPQTPSAPSAPTARRVLPFVGWLALAVAVVAAVTTGVGVGLASDGQFVAGAALAWVAIVLSCAAVAGGILAVVVNWGRMPGAIAIALGLLANPFLLARLLDAASAATG